MDACQAFLDELHFAYLVAKTARKNEMDGRRVSRFDARGLHPFTYAYACAAVWFQIADLPSELMPSAHEVDIAGFEDGTAEWLDGKAAVSGQEVQKTTFQIQDESHSV